MNIQELKQKLELFHQEIGEDGYQFRAGLQKESHRQEIYAKHPLFTKENIAVARKARDEEQSPHKKQLLRLLFVFMCESFIGNAVSSISDAANKYAADAFITIDNETIPLQQVRIKMTTEKDRDKRKRLWEATQVHTAKLTEFSRRSLDMHESLSKEFGFDRYVDLVLESNIRFDKLLPLARKILKETESTYAIVVKHYQDIIGSSSLETWDTSFAMHTSIPNAHFSEERLLSILPDFFEGLNIDIPPGLLIDTEKRATKHPRACCIYVRIPDKIVLLLSPRSGFTDFTTLFHEAGHGMHMSFTPSSAVYEEKRLGYSSIAEVQSFTLEHVMYQIPFLMHYFSLARTDAEHIHKMSRKEKLFFVRRYATKFLYDYKLRTNDLRKFDDDWVEGEETYSSPEEMYAVMLKKATGFRYPKNNFLLDHDPDFYSSDYFHAWIIEAQVRSFFKKTFGEKWFLTADAGKKLVELWKLGRAILPKDYDKHIKGDAYDVTSLLADFEVLRQ
jgi:oligoendopeptidase F